MNYRLLQFAMSVVAMLFSTTFVSLGQVPKGACTDLMVTEVKFGKEVDANGNITAINHAVELFNTTEDDIDLSQYTLELIPDEGVPTVMNLNGTIPSHGTYVLTHVNSNTGLIALADAVELLLTFDGKVAIELKKGAAVKDKIGKEGVSNLALDIDLNELIADPIGYLENAEIDLGSIENLTIKRKPIVQKGKSSFDVESFLEEWDVYPESFSQGLGEHMNACVAPFLAWEDDVLNLPENYSTFTEYIVITGSQPDFVDGSINALPAPGAPYQADANDWNQTEYSVSIPPNWGQYWNTSPGAIIDDSQPEQTESFALSLDVWNGGSSNSNDYLVVNIADNDGLSIDENELSSSITVAPSVFQRFFTLSTNNPSLIIESVMLIDVSGKSVSQIADDVTGASMNFNSTESLSAGYITAIIRTNKGTTVKKLLKIDEVE